MPSLSVITWNVLHRVHADNWQEPAIEAHPDEQARSSAIAEEVAARLEQVDALLLQEVSGDQLAALRSLGIEPLFMRYRRVPTARRLPNPLADGSEHLVIVGRGAGTPVVQHGFADDPGKGVLAASCGEASLLCAHLSHGERYRGQWQEVVTLASGLRAPVILGGDLNADRETAAALLGPAARWGQKRGELPTRPRAAPSDKSTDIDHVVVWGGQVEDLEVLDGRGLSDHNPVRALIWW